MNASVPPNRLTSPRPIPEDPGITYPLTVFLVCLLGTALQIWLLWLSSADLGVPDEWNWKRFQIPPGYIWNLLPTLGMAMVLVLYIWWGVSKHPQSGEQKDLKWLGGLVILGIGWVFTVISADPSGAGLGRNAFVMFYPRTSGYFYQALYDDEDLPNFLATYEERIIDSTDPENHLHLGTHPPGLTTFNRLLIELCQVSPTLTNILKFSQPASVQEAMTLIRQAQAQSGKSFVEPAQAALWLSIILTKIVSVMTVLPLYAMGRRFYTGETAKLIAGFWLLIPATLIFMPKSDAFFPFLSMLLSWLWLKCLERNSLIYGIVTALVFVIAASLSLAFATIGVVLLMQLIYHAKRIRTGFWPTASGVITGLAVLLTLYFAFDMNLIAIWLQNFQNHAAFYDHNSRTYVSWLLVNPIELTVALGLPLAVCSLVGGTIMARHYQERDYFDVVAVLIVWFLLYITGKNMGEAARLWLFLMPYAVLMAGPVLERMIKSATQFGRPALWLGLLLLQAIVCVTTAIRIDGFGFTEL